MLSDKWNILLWIVFAFMIDVPRMNGISIYISDPPLAQCLHNKQFSNQQISSLPRKYGWYYSPLTFPSHLCNSHRTFSCPLCNSFRSNSPIIIVWNKHYFSWITYYILTVSHYKIFGVHVFGEFVSEYVNTAFAI